MANLLEWESIKSNSNKLTHLKGYASLAQVDPYLIWADLRGFQGFDSRRCNDGGNSIVALIESTTDKVADSQPKSARFQARTVELNKLQQTIDAAERLQLAVPRTEIVGLRAALPDIDRLYADLSKVLDTADNSKLAGLMADSGNVPVVGVIDHGYGFLNRAFGFSRDRFVSLATQTRTRIAGLWNQDRRASMVDGVPPDGFSYGIHLDYRVIDELRDQFPDEMSAYRDMQYTPAMRRRSHGSHVLSMLAGYPNPAANIETATKGTAGTRDDPASILPIVAVQLPYLPDKDTSGGGLSANILDGIRYIKRVAGDRPVVINISDGAMAGSHRGESMIERAIDEMFGSGELDQTFDAVVVAAGNGFESRTHCRGELGAGAAFFEVPIQVLSGDRTDTFIEVWIDNVADTDGLQISLTPPFGGARSVCPDEISVGMVHCQPVVAMFGPANRPQVAKQSRRMALICISHTVPLLEPSKPAPAPDGLWTLRVSKANGQPITADCWIERDEIAYGHGSAMRQARFTSNIRSDPGSSGEVTGDDTVNSIGTGKRTIVVGAARFSDKRIAAYSAAGPKAALNLDLTPTVTGIAEQTRGLPGVRVAATESGDSVRVSGTSLAAPFVGRALLNTLVNEMNAATPKKKSLKQQLIDSGSQPRGHVPDPRHGYHAVESTDDF